MGRKDVPNDQMATPGAGPSTSVLNSGPLRPNVVAQREESLRVRRQELTEVMDHHDDLVREAFHLEKFVTLVAYDPKAAKSDRSTVFEEYRAEYDLLRNTQQDARSARKTRGAAQDLRDLLTTPSAPSLSVTASPAHISPSKGKGKVVPRPPVPIPLERSTIRQLSTLNRTPNAVKTPIQNRALKTTPSGQSGTHPPPSPVSPIKIRLKRPSSSFQYATNGVPDVDAQPRSLRPRSRGNRPDGSADSPNRPASSGKHKTTESPIEPPRPLLKRIKLVHRPRLEVSAPFQLPPPPVFRSSLPALMESYFYLDEETTFPAEEIHHLDAIAEREARKRNRIDELQASGVFADHERKIDVTPPVEPKRPPDFQDHLVAHAIQLSKTYRENSKARIAGAKRIARMIEKHFERAAGADTREQKAEERRKAMLVKLTTKEIVNQWRLAVTIVRDRKREAEKIEQMRRGKQHLDAFLQQSTQVLEAQHTDLAAGRAKQRSTSRSSAGWRTNSEASRSRASSPAVADVAEEYLDEESDYFKAGAIGSPDIEVAAVEDKESLESSEDEEEILLMESPAAGRDTDADPSPEIEEPVLPSPRAGETPTEDIPTPSVPSLEMSIDVSLATRDISLVEDAADEYPKSLPSLHLSSDRVSDTVDGEFQQTNEAFEVIDAQLDAEMEADEADDSDDNEVDELQKDADLSIEELLRRYGYPSSAAPDVPEPSSPTAVPLNSPGNPTKSTAELPLPLPGPEPHAIAVDDDFQAVEYSSAIDSADGAPELEMEVEEGIHSDDDEVDGLALDADVPIEELLQKYGFGRSTPFDQSAVESDNAPTLTGTGERKDSTTIVQVSPRSPFDDGQGPDYNASSVSSPADRPLSPPLEGLAVGENEDDGDSDSGDEDDEDDEEPSSPDIASARDLDPPNGVEENAQVPPPFLLRGTLRPYQQAGLEWLASLYSNNTNGILADEMGLGKTIQTIALLGWLACSRGQWGPHLVIVPTSVLLNWEMEFKRFFPGFKTLSYYGNQKERREKRQGWNSPNAFNVCITSYQLALADQQMFRRKKWVYMILDEAHNIKNFKSKRWETLLCFNAQHRLLLTGTPLQNNLMELWSLLYFLMPDEGFTRDTEDAQLFVRRQDFKDLFQNPVERAIETGHSMTDETKDTVQKLHTLLRPYLLRRLKSEVEKQLPGKHEHIVYCRLSKRQRFLYDEFMSRAATRETLASGNFLSIVNCLMQLRKVCNHPALFEVRPIITSFAMAKSAVADYEIKELLVRRKLLSFDAGDRPDLELLGLQVTHVEPAPLLAMRSTRRLDASSRFPYVSETLGKAPPMDTRTIIGWKAHREYERRSSTITRWKHIAYVNRSRCNKTSVYPAELLRTVDNIYQPLSPLAIAAQGRRHYLDRVDAVYAMVKSHEERLHDVSDQIDHFAFATPKVVARDVASLSLSGPPRDAIRRQTFETGFDTLHRPAVKLQIAFPDASLIQFDCGKLQELDVLLRERAAGGHRVLIFTQMTKVLDILEIFLNLHGYRYLRLDGATKIEQRQIITERFNVDSRIFAFIASSRSGGVGINLTGADTVIFYDSDYNPSMDRQCEDRAHRIGQTREVHIYRFISSHTVEESMLRKANQKRSLDDMVIQKGEFDWRKVLADELEGTSAGKKLEDALAVVEDKEDVEAAKVAAAEINLDQTEFSENALLDAGAEEVCELVPSVGGTTDRADDVLACDDDGEPVEGEDDIGTIAEYLIRMVERDWEFFGFERPYGAR